MRPSSCTPFAFAAIIARRSAMFCATLRAGYRPDESSAIVSASRRRPRSTSRKLSISTPSSSTVRESDGIEPGVIPPTSAWWPREPT